MKKSLKHLCIMLVLTIILITPIKVNASSIILTKSEILLDTGYYEVLEYSLEPGLNSSDIVWKSSNESVAIVENGKVTAISNGSTIITATINGNSTTCKVIVNSNYISVTGINLNTNNLSVIKGTTATLTYTITPSNATNKNATWTSSDESVATVENGKITAKKIGTTIITVSSFGYRATCKVTVVDTIGLKSIGLNKTEITIKEHETYNLNVAYSPQNASNKKVTWKSNDTDIVTVDTNGKLIAKKAGTATITVVSNDGGYVATCKVTVTTPSKNVTSVKLDKKEVNLLVGEETTLKYTITPSYAENQKVTWTSSDGSIATVKDGVIKAIAPGTAEIKVISVDGEKEAICKVKVTAKPLEAIVFDTEEISVEAEKEITLKPQPQPANSVIDKAIWTSSDETIATVENGVVKGLQEGTATITVSNENNKISASIIVRVTPKPKEELNITIEGYNLHFDKNKINYTLTIKDEESLNIIVNSNNVTINGNQKLKDGSVITITIQEEEKTTYVINIKKQKNYTIYFIAIISLLLLLNLIRILIQNNKSKRK